MEENITQDATADEQYESRSTVEQVREEGKITAYNFRILVRDKPPIVGKFTRDEVDLMFRLYSREGANLSRRAVSRYFPLYTFQEFIKILRAFNLTQSSAPFAPHIIEEKTTDELIELNLQQKENNYLKKYELVKEQEHIKKYHDLLKYHHDLRQAVDNFSEFVGNIKPEFKFKISRPEYSNNITLMVYLSDMHIGAEVSPYSIYRNPYNRAEVESRMQRVLDQIFKLSKLTGATNLVICNLGDSLDGYNAQTTRGGHLLPQNMNNKDQHLTFVNVMLDLFKTVAESEVFDSISYVSVEGGNHDGDFGYFANRTLEAELKSACPEIEVTLFDQFINYVEIGEHTFIFCHGKDDKDMVKNLPLTLTDKAENYINAFIFDRKITSKNIHFVKGDLHQTASTYGKIFRYKSVGSFFGSSEWIHKNFGNTKAAVDFDIIDGENILETRLLLN